MFDKRQKSFAKRIHLVNDDSLYDQRAFSKVNIAFYSSSTFSINIKRMNKNYHRYCRKYWNRKKFKTLFWVTYFINMQNE